MPNNLCHLRNLREFFKICKSISSKAQLNHLKTLKKTLMVQFYHIKQNLRFL